MAETFINSLPDDIDELKDIIEYQRERLTALQKYLDMVELSDKFVSINFTGNRNG